MNRLGTAAGAVLALVALLATGACTNSGEPPSTAAHEHHRDDLDGAHEHHRDDLDGAHEHRAAEHDLR